MYCKSFTISKNALGKDHTICMQAFLSCWIWKEKKEKKEKKIQMNRITFKVCFLLCPQSVFKVSVLLTEVTKSSISPSPSPPPHTQLIHGGVDSLGSLPHDPLSRGFMRPTPSETLLIAAGSRGPKKGSSVNSRGIVGKVWVKSFDCANEMS